MRVFVTGIAGFAGSHLADNLSARDGFVVGGLLRPNEPTRNIDHLSERIDLATGDLLDGTAVAAALASFRPDAVVHLAGIAFVPSSPEFVERVNVGGSRALLEAMRMACPEARGVFVSSSEVYGKIRPSNNPVNEDHPVAPANPYAHSKRMMEKAVREAAETHGLNVVVLRPFNHIGPRQSPDFAVSSFAQQIASIESGSQPPAIEVGNLAPRRDFTDVRDIADAYCRAIEIDAPGPFNLASGTSRSIQEVLDRLIALSAAKIEIRQNADRMRPSENPDVVGDASRFRDSSGWTPSVPFDQSLRDTLEYWRNAV